MPDIKFWLQRVHNEKSREAQQIVKRMDDLIFQLYNFDSMREEIQKEVMSSLIEDMDKYGWSDAINELRNSDKERMQ